MLTFGIIRSQMPQCPKTLSSQGSAGAAPLSLWSAAQDLWKHPELTSHPGSLQWQSYSGPLLCTETGRHPPGSSAAGHSQLGTECPEEQVRQNRLVTIHFKVGNMLCARIWTQWKRQRPWSLYDLTSGTSYCASSTQERAAVFVTCYTAA